MQLVSKSTSTTYEFRSEERGWRGWANCTVNDSTGELNIQSDWGKWSYRWSPNPEHLGAPTLTAFIGDRGCVDYLARKLQNEGRGCHRWSGVATARALQRQLCERRFNDGRCQLEGRLEPEDLVDGQVPPRLRGRYTQDGLPITSGMMPSNYRYGWPWDASGKMYEALPYLSKESARRIYDAIGDLGAELDRSSDLFYERAFNIEGFADYVTAEPWNYSETEQTPGDRALRDFILPALIAACRDRRAAPMSSEQTIQGVVAYLRAHAATFDVAVAAENAELSTRYAYVKRQAVHVMADRIEAGDWKPAKAVPQLVDGASSGV